ncbi:7507_t:CDS:2 [Cetraspora pellucida]|uniref:7507_t:CDS:1 n=1 Tax=Cetraspora pellucida TaxID=1433469 RepID=A0ACA9KVH5_9GLOM|nr:7507_t:CDS:2 [Cetraspora pellucida]
MDNKVLCTCVWCLRESDNQRKLVSRSTCTRHSSKQKKTWPNSAHIPNQRRNLITSISQISSAVASTSSAIPSITLSYTSQSEKNQNCINTELNNLFSSNDEYNKILESEREYEECNEKDNEKRNDEYNNEDNEEYNDEYNEKDNGKDNDEYDEGHSEDTNKGYNEDNDSERYSEGDYEGFNDDYGEYNGNCEEYNEDYDEYNEERNEEDNNELNENINLENLFKGLRLFRIKNQHNISDAAFNEILKTLEISEITIYRLQKILGDFVPLKPILVDCCINSCVAFTNELINMNQCSECNEPRYKFGKNSRVSRKSAAYWSLISSLQMQYKDKAQAETLRYRHIYTSTHEYMIGCRYDPKNLPLRTHKNYLADITTIEHLNGSSRKYEVQERGKLLIDDNQISNSEYVIPKTNWTEIGNGPEIPNHSESRIFIIEGAEEKLYSLSSSYCMNKTEEQHLRAYYATALNKPINQLKSITNSVQKYGKLQTKRGLIINSRLSNRKGDVMHKNFCIAAKLLVDRNAHHKNAPVILEMREFFGEVCYFFSHQYDDQWSMLAYVQWVRNPHISKHGLSKFRDLGSFEIINISAIDRNVGFLKLSNNETYIVDKENQIKFR